MSLSSIENYTFAEKNQRNNGRKVTNTWGWILIIYADKSAKVKRELYFDYEIKTGTHGLMCSREKR